MNSRKRDETWERITELAFAIIDQAAAQGSVNACRNMAEEIKLQCNVLERGLDDAE